MKTISYTRMRDELADVLEALRNGEQVVVTQRGKKCLILGGRAVEDADLPSDIAATHALLEELTALRQENAMLNRSFEEELEIKRKGQAILESLQSYGKRAPMSFEESLEMTKVRHAKVIKALGDK